MAILTREIDGRPLLFSEKLQEAGVPHAFGTRLGGGSQGMFSGANMSFFNGDERPVVRENWQGMLSRCEVPSADLHVLRQVHGTRVLRVEVPTNPQDVHFHGAGDGLETEVSGQALGVITADCIPVLLYFSRGEAPGEGPRVAAIHSGWKGSVEGILPRFLAQVGRPPDVVAIGPHIRRERFEVGPEVVPDFERAFEAAGGIPVSGIERGQGDRFLVDLEALVLGQIEAAGVPSKALDLGAPCTHSNPDLFFSYRRDGPGRGLLGHTILLPEEVAS